jgi:hypothetical protein
VVALCLLGVGVVRAIVIDGLERVVRDRGCSVRLADQAARLASSVVHLVELGVQRDIALTLRVLKIHLSPAGSSILINLTRA